MTQFILDAANVYIANDLSMNIKQELPVATYAVSVSMERGYFLTKVEDFALPSKIYGNTFSRATRFLDTFSDRPGTTGALLTGVKGSGKSLEMKTASIEGLKRGYPSIIVGSDYCGEGFNKFISQIQQPCIMIFDEFEKVYSQEKQELLLTLFDGTFTTKKLVILTCNDRFKVNSHMSNRPGRIFYMVNYKGLEDKFIREYCADRLHDKTKTDTISVVAGLIENFNFDMLQALVEELNRYPEESVKQAIDILNINFDYTARADYTLKAFKDGIELDRKLLYPTYATNIMSQTEVTFGTYDKNPEVEYDEGEEEVYIEHKFEMGSKEVKPRPDLKEIVFLRDNWKFIATRVEPKTYDYSHLF